MSHSQSSHHDTSGFRYVRAFDRRRKDFRDFVITRMRRPVMLKESEVLPHEKSDQDIQWTRIVELELVPHPDQPHPRSRRWITA